MASSRKMSSCPTSMYAGGRPAASLSRPGAADGSIVRCSCPAPSRAFHAVARRLAVPPREQRGPVGRDHTVVGDVDFAGGRLRFVAEVPQHGVERYAAAGDVTGRQGWRLTVLFNP